MSSTVSDHFFRGAHEPQSGFLCLHEPIHWVKLSYFCHLIKWPLRTLLRKAAYSEGGILWAGAKHAMIALQEAHQTPTLVQMVEKNLQLN